MKQALRKHPKEVKSEEDMKKKWISTQTNVGQNVVQDVVLRGRFVHLNMVLKLNETNMEKVQ